jgi:hypothetical protein
METEDGYADSIFCGYVSAPMYGTYSNITVYSKFTNLFSSDAGISGNFSDITFGDYNPIIYSLFSAPSGGISGKFKNISTEYNQNTLFYCDGEMNIEAENIFLQNVSSIFNSVNSDIIGTFKNIRIKNSVSTTSDLFSAPTGLIDIVLNDFVIGSGARNRLFSCDGALSGTYSNIEIGNTFSNVFSSSGGYSGFFENIRIGTCFAGEVFANSDFISPSYINNLETNDTFRAKFIGTIKYSTLRQVADANRAFNVGENTIIEHCAIYMEDFWEDVPVVNRFSVFNYSGGPVLIEARYNLLKQRIDTDFFYAPLNVTFNGTITLDDRSYGNQTDTNLDYLN